MRIETRSFLDCTITKIIALAAIILFVSSEPYAQVSGDTDVDMSQKKGDEEECAIAKNPTNPNQLFSLCNNFDGPGLFAARSIDGGATWTYPDPVDRTIADGDTGQGPAACCDPNLAWDSFGNLFLTYLDRVPQAIVTLVSTDGGATFSTVASFGPASVDQPTVVAVNTSAPGAPVALWIVWNQANRMVARGAAVTGSGTVGAFGALQTIPGTIGCSFGDISVAPSGAVVQACQNPTGGQGPATIVVNTDADGLGTGNFGPAVMATTTNVGGFDFIPAQSLRSVDSEAGLAFDRNPASPHFGRLYLMYTEETVNENNDMDIMLRFSDNNGATWSVPPIRVNDDPASPIRSQFLPKISSDPQTGNIAVCWYDARNSATNTAMQVFCTIATPAGATPMFPPNAQIGDAPSTSNSNPNNFGDYSGLDYFQGFAHPIWADTSNSTGGNPDGLANFDVATDRVKDGTKLPERDDFEYAAKLICGLQPEAKDMRLVRGFYATAINIHNPNDKPVEFDKELALTYPPEEQKPGKIFPIAHDKLGPNEALAVDCMDVEREVFPQGFPEKYIKGFVVIKSNMKLDVTAVYTAAGLDKEANVQSVTSIDVEQIDEQSKVGKPDQCPDLTIRDISPPSVNCPGGGGTCVTKLDYMIENIGSGDAGPFDVKSVLDPNQSVIVNQSVPTGLAAGAALPMTVVTPPGGNCFDPDCAVTITADSINKVPECNEQNNTGSNFTPG
jgi:hypothetical protein